MKIIVLIVGLGLFASFGHIINDYADREPDRVVGKKKILSTLGEPLALTAIVVPAIGMVALVAGFFDRYTLAISVVGLLVAAAYSLPPVRLKERGVGQV